MAERLKRMFTVAAISTIALLGTAACSSSEPTADEDQADTATLDVETAKTAAEEYIETLSLDIGFPDCEWNADDDQTGIVYMSTCESDELILATGDQSAVKVWAEDMASNTDFDAYVILGDDYAISAADKGNVLRARDLLGADAELITGD